MKTNRLTAVKWLAVWVALLGPSTSPRLFALDGAALQRRAAEAARRGDQEGALALLEQALAAGLESPMNVVAEPEFQSLRETSRLRELLARHGTASTASIASRQEAGVALLVRGLISDENGQPVPGAAIYLYHTQPDGLYSTRGDERSPRFYAYLTTDPEGRFELATLRPGPYPNSDIPQHVHYRVQADGFRTQVAEFLFDDDPRLKSQARSRAESSGWPIVKTSTGKDGRQECEVVIRVAK